MFRSKRNPDKEVIDTLNNKSTSILIEEDEQELSPTDSKLAKEAFDGLNNYILGFDFYHLWHFDDTDEAFLRFKNGAWNRQHINPVTAALKKHASTFIYNGKEFVHAPPIIYDGKAFIKDLLTDLQKELLEETKELNPQGHLAKCIEEIQAKTKTTVIDLNALNQTIRKKKLQKELNEKDGYSDALRILEEYYGHYRPLAAKLAPFARFFKGKWSRNNITAVSATVLQASGAGTTTEDKVYNLLKELKKQLQTEGKEINPKGDLAKCIEEIQLKNNVDLINIQVLNEEIKKDAVRQEVLSGQS
jgi:hypothetical protein